MNETKNKKNHEMNVWAEINYDVFLNRYERAKSITDKINFDEDLGFLERKSAVRTLNSFYNSFISLKPAMNYLDQEKIFEAKNRYSIVTEVLASNDPQAISIASKLSDTAQAMISQYTMDKRVI